LQGRLLPRFLTFFKLFFGITEVRLRATSTNAEVGDLNLD